MLEVLKFGSNKYGVWVIGHLNYQELEITDIFNTNLKDTSILKEKDIIKIKKFKISRSKNKNLVFSLEF